MKKRLKWLIPLVAVAIMAAVVVVALILRDPKPDPIVYEPGTIIYQGDQVTAKVVAPAAQRQITYGMKIPMSEEEVFNIHHIIAVGTVHNIREVEIAYTSYGRPTSRTISLFDFQVEQYLKNESNNASSKDVLTVGLSYSSYGWDNEIPELKEGSEFLFFLMAMDCLNEEDPMDREKFSDAWVYSPSRLAFGRTDGKYNVTSFFSDFFSDSQRTVIETQLIELIQQKLTRRQEVN